MRININAEVLTNLYVLGRFNEQGKLMGILKSGRPQRHTVYETRQECINAIRQLKKKYNGNLKPIRIITGEVVE